MEARLRNSLWVAAALVLASPAQAQSPDVGGCSARLQDGARGTQQLAPSDQIQGVKLRRLASGAVIHRFFDTSPMSPSGRYVALLRLGSEDRSPRPGDPADVVLIDLQSGIERVVAKTAGWEMQLGAQVQWGRDDSQLFFSDVDTVTWLARTVLLDPFTGKRRFIRGPLFMASSDGSTLAGHDPLTSRYAQVGYGVVVPDDRAPRVSGPSASNGVYVTDVSTGKVTLIASAAQIFSALGSKFAVESPENHEFYVFQTKWNPQRTRLMVSFQWAPRSGGERRRAVVTMRPDGTQIKIAIRPDQWAKGGHHMNWTADGEHVSMNLNVDGVPGLEFVSVRYDGSDLRTLYAKGSGHPSQHPAGLPLFVTDAYPDEPLAKGDGSVPIRLIDIASKTEEEVGRVFVSDKQGEFRVDPHPAWDRTGRYVIFNGFVGCTRNVWLIDLKDHVEKAAERSGRGKRAWRR